MSSSIGEYDYVIVGGGSAGCVLANRLSADASKTVCLLEAGPRDDSAFISIPAGIVFLLQQARYNWLYTTIPQHWLGGREVAVPRGKTLGGSSSINSMVYVRGRPSDYDRWSELGCKGWDWSSVLPYFRRSENNDRLGSSDHHGDSGPLHVEDPRSPQKLSKAFLDAAAELKLPANDDFNGPRQEGFGYYQATMHHGRRWSAADAFLRPAITRNNLTILTGAEAVRVRFSGRRATAVEIRRGAELHTIRVRDEAVLAAGAVGSPALLLKSGVGPGEQVQRLGVTPAWHLSGVGENLHEHPTVPVHYRGSKEGYALSLRTMPKLALAPIHYAFTRRGVLASNMVEAGGFFRTSAEIQEPDMQVHFIPGRVGEGKRRLVWGHGYYADICLLKPRSRGRLWLEPAGEALVPKIDFGMLSDPADEDDLVRGLTFLRRLLATSALAKYGAVEALPGPSVNRERDLREYVRRRAGPGYHPVGTCRMGSDADPSAVVDATLKVRGAENLRVVDASVMPEMPAGNTNAPTLMIAERAADIIRSARA